MTAHRGSCLCGRVRFELDGDLGEFGYCHCRACQKASGSAHAANAPIDRSLFRLVTGADVLKEFESSPGKYRAFCSACGSPIYARLSATPDTLRIRLGVLDTPFGKHARAHTWLCEKADWERLVDDLPKFERWADRSILHQKGSKQDLIGDST